MILPNIILPELVNHYCETSGVDTYEHCFNKSHFKAYPYKVTYQYNSRGFRDKEWPSNLQDCIWCVGDSFTVGLGTIFENTWTQVLSKVSNKPVINISMDGASNQWISRKCIEIIKEINPSNMVIMWSYAHRRESNNATITDLERRMHYKAYQTEFDDCMTFNVCLNSVVRHARGNLIHFTVPNAVNFSNTMPYIFKKVKNFIGEVDILDFARDGWHFDVKSSEKIVNQILPLLTE